jgi:hypothetical protein
VNEHCAERGRSDRIPPDRAGASAGADFRKTLCRHIYRKPRGLVAAAIQCGTSLRAVTLSYARTAALGFPDALAFKEFLARLDDLLEDTSGWTPVSR